MAQWREILHPTDVFLIDDLMNLEDSPPSQTTIDALISMLVKLHYAEIPRSRYIADDSKGNVYLSWDRAFLFYSAKNKHWTMRINNEKTTEEPDIIVTKLEGLFKRKLA